MGHYHRSLVLVFFDGAAELADLSLTIISVCQGEDIPRKGGPAITRSDLLIVNKTDLALHVGADLEVMRADAAKGRGERPVVFTDLKRRAGVEEVVSFLRQNEGLDLAIDDDVTPAEAAKLQT